MNPERIVWVAATKVALFAGVALISVAPVLSASAAQGSTAKVLAPRGIELNDLDRAADPCTDFYAFANGSWRAGNPIPEGTQRWSRRTAGSEINRQQLTTLLEELAAKVDRSRGSIEQQLGDHFAACMNEPSIDAAGVAPLAPWLADIAGVQDAKDVQRMIRRLHDLAIPASFVVTSASDYHDPESVVANIAADGLGLPGRDYYLKPDPRFAEARAKYREHVARLLTLAGMPAVPAQKAADEIVALETRLAEASLAPEVAADPAATAHKLTFAQLSQLAKHIDWDRYFTEASIPRIDVNVAEPAFIERLDRELEATPVTTWKAYLTWHLIESAAPWLSKPFADESFAFKNEYLGGAVAREPRASICLESTEDLLGEPLGRVYAERYFPPEAKAKVQEMVRTLLAVFSDDLGELKWMSDAPRQQALAKVAAFEVMVGYPNAWTDHSALAIRRDAFWSNVAAARRFGVETRRKRIGQRTSRAIWQLPPSSSGAYIDIQLNVMGLPAGFLQAPAFDLAASDAVNYGAIGIGMAHDLTHAIDALGRDFDSTGQPRNWWTEADLDAFQRVGQCTVDQYDGYAIEPGVHLEGKQVLGEALGDLAGMRLAYRALQRSMQRHPVPVIDGFSPEQQFFIAWGQFRGAAESLELQRQMVKTDSHPTAKYRVIGPLSNAPEFQQAFACKAGSAMVRPPQQRCTVW
ncbi:MAG TPA: M13 family metallopeptidase [Thermoanaerobaculia bacterium]|jgi:endothelin-converting enzyme/putative endopeptidase|nr:M13 family metallopeptidase [Thermoanaerobaculia bacterium]